MYELIVIWYNGEKEQHTYDTREEAEERAEGYKKAFGNQISWVGVDRRSIC